MPPKFSAYLDIVRFTAAFTVFLGHAAGKFWTGGFLWPLGAYGDTCVVVFFVLSGFVIGYVSDTKETHWQEYAVNRVARLWSVVLPALLLTLVIDYAGVRIAPDLYLNRPWYGGDMEPLRYLASFFLVHDFWSLGLTPGINQPFWSLSFEGLYYVVFGIAFFAHSRWKWCAITVTLLISGPIIAVMLPVWLMGFYCYRMTKQWHPPLAVSMLAFIAGLGLLSMSPAIRTHMSTLAIHGVIVERYIDAFSFLLNLVGAYGLCLNPKPLPARVAKSITHIAGTTFTLYLFHRPLIQMFSYLGPDDASSWGRRVLVIGGTLGIIYVLTPITETLRRWMRKEGTRILAGQAASPLIKTST
jgi:peptidoglycan/LPS O-acetylase OafA/YrhL